MKYFFIFSFLLFSISSLHGQALMDDPNNIYQTKNGKELTFEQAEKLLYSSQKYQLDKKKLKDGTVLVTLIPISDKDFQRNIQKNQKRVKKLKGSKMVPFELKDKDGTVVSNSSLKGKLTIYNFWFTGCRPCLQEMPQLNKLVEKYGDDVNFVAPTFEDDGKVSNFLNRRTFKYNTLASGVDLIKSLSITSFPTHLVVNDKGTIVKSITGASEDIGKILEKLIKNNL